MDMPREDKSELYMKALDYAKENNLDIQNIEDVKKIAEALDPDHTSDKELEDLKYQLNNAKIFLNITGAKERSVN
jgi:hypothetical protein